MGQTGRDRRRADPWSILTEGVSLLGSLDLGDITHSLATLANPDAGFLEMLGRTREERVEKMATMLRTSSPADMEEIATVYALALAKGAETHPGPGAEKPRKRRDQTSAEWRKERRLAS